MKGLRREAYKEQIRDLQNNLVEYSDIDKLKMIHELIDDTPFKTQDYMQYQHDEYYIEHRKKDILKDVEVFYELQQEMEPNRPVKDLIIQRYSNRDFTNKTMSFTTLSNIIFYAMGTKHYGRGAYSRRKFPFKFSNSQGGLNYLDMYVFIQDVEGIPSGIYYYDFVENRLAQLDHGNIRKILNEIHYQNEFVTYSNATLCVVSDLSRVVPKYYKRSYRFSHVDTGILCAYIQLLAENEGASSCLVAGFLEHHLENILNLSDSEIPICSIPLGFR